MKHHPEISIDLTAQELTDPPTVAPIEFDDIDEFDPLQTPRKAANNDAKPLPQMPEEDDDTIEIELTAEQMDALLSGRPIR